MKRIYLLLLMVFFFVSCSSKKSVIQTTRNGANTAASRYDRDASKTSQIIESTSRVKITNEIIVAYIDKYGGIAQSNMGTYGIPASIILSQALLESGYGTAPLCVQANNHFGIKCHKDWTGESVSYDDDSIGECFRKYNNPTESFRDHAVFLTSGSRYAPLFNLDIKDYKAWAKGLRDAGYATDTQYPAKLITLIEKYQLYKYDTASYYNTKSNNYASRETERYVVSKGDTLYSISKKYNISVEELKRQNNIFDNAISIGQSLLILK